MHAMDINIFNFMREKGKYMELNQNLLLSLWINNQCHLVDGCCQCRGCDMWLYTIEISKKCVYVQVQKWFMKLISSHSHTATNLLQNMLNNEMIKVDSGWAFNCHSLLRQWLLTTNRVAKMGVDFFAPRNRCICFLSIKGGGVEYFSSLVLGTVHTIK